MRLARVCPLSSLTALWTDLSPGSEQRSERRGSFGGGNVYALKMLRVIQQRWAREPSGSRFAAASVDNQAGIRL